MRINPAFLLAALTIVAVGCKSGDSSGNETKVYPHVKDLVMVDTKKGTGDPLAKGDEAWVLYKGTLMNGTVFDTNIKEGGVPFHLEVGSGQVIKGWDQGLLGMRKGGKRSLTIPYALAYGEAGSSPKIPPEADLKFDVEMLYILKKEDAQSISANDVTVGQGREVKKGDTVTIDYDAKVYGESFEKQKGVTFKIGGEGMRINGFDTALIGMKVGGKRDITVPPALSRLVGNDKLGMNVGVWTVTLKSIK